jgi:hypothetical protein
MSNGAPRSRGSLTGALLLIAIGGIFLYANLRPEWNPWPIIGRYWPVLLIVLGLGKLFDVLRSTSAPGAAPAPRRGGEAFAILLVVLLLILAVAGSHRFSRLAHWTESVDAQGANSVRMDIEMPTGELRISGGAAKLLEGEFDYRQADGQPSLSYTHSGTEGNLSISQPGRSHFGRVSGADNHWDIHLNSDAARELRVEMGAGKGDLDLKGIHLTKLTVEIGAGEINTDLTGNWKDNVDVRIEGGVGSATVRLPHDVGVRVHAEGGIGSINVRGLQKRDSYYVNDAYGTSPVTMNVSVEGGVGEIRLIAQ